MCEQPESGSAWLRCLSVVNSFLKTIAYPSQFSLSLLKAF